jgi:WD40 repeat protein
MNNLKHPLRYSLPCLIAASISTTALYPMATFAEDMVCHAVADNDKRGDSEDMLVKIYSDGRAIEVGKGTGTKHMEAISFDINGETLYVAAEPADGSDGSRFGTLDLNEESSTLGQFVPIGDGLGTANGEEGEILIDDVDGLTFDYAKQGIVYATLRREHTNPPQYDLLFKVDLYTGKVTPNAFGTDIDYVPVKVTGDCAIDTDSRAQDDYYDIDDIASDPKGGKLYVIANTGNGVESVLAWLVEENSMPTGEAVCIGSTPDDIESLDFEKNPQPDGSYQLYGTTGNGGHRKGDDPTVKGHIYLIDKATGASSQRGKLQQPDQPNRDYEAVSCEPIDIIGRLTSSCFMYALHDEGRADSQLVKIDPFAGSGIGAISPLGPLYPGLDIEGLAILPTNGKLYGTSGSDQKCRRIPKLDNAGKQMFSNNGKPKTICDRDADGNKLPYDGALYEYERATGLIEYIGLTGYSEVSGFALRSADNTLWGWARGGNRRQKTEAGPVIIDPNGSDKKQLGTLVKAFPFHKPDIQSIAWSNDGKKLYAATPTDEGSDLWAYDYDSQELELICPKTVPAEIEAMEMQPNDLLLLGTHHKRDIGMVAYDPEKCQVVATRVFKNVPEYYDIESIEWPAAECGERSWLYETSGDAEIQLIEYDIVPGDVVDAVCLALKCDENDDILVERDVDTVKVYSGEQVFIARPAILGGPRQGMRQGEDGCMIIETASGEEYELCPIAGDEDILEEEVPGIEIADNIVTLGDMACHLDLLQMPTEVEEGQSKVRVDLNIQEVKNQQCFGGIADTLPDYLVTWPNGNSQLCCSQ